jgi:hypothetical protein
VGERERGVESGNRDDFGGVARGVFNVAVVVVVVVVVGVVVVVEAGTISRGGRQSGGAITVATRPRVVMERGYMMSRGGRRRERG